jgi:hypothetical protein
MLVPPEYFRQIIHSLSPAPAAAAAAAAPVKPMWSKNSFSFFGYFLCDSDEFKYLKAQDTGVDCCISLWFWFFLLRKRLANLERTTAIIIKERYGNKVT